MQLGNHRWSHVWVIWILYGFAHWQLRRLPPISFADYGIKSLCGGMARDGPLKFHEQYTNESSTSDYSITCCEFTMGDQVLSRPITPRLLVPEKVVMNNAE